jgi:hypothetical protein
MKCHSERSEESHSMTLALRTAECQTVRSLAKLGMTIPHDMYTASAALTPESRGR